METLTRRIIDFNYDRIPEITALKYSAMAENMFRFYRGTNHIFYEDLHAAAALPASPLGWIAGDLHLENFGTYKSDNRLVYFDLNDFDEALLAPCSWELVRILTSIFIAFESLGVDEKKAGNMAQLFLKKYAAFLSLGKPAYIERQTAQGIVRDFLKTVQNRKQQVILDKRTVVKNNKIFLQLDESRHFALKKRVKRDLCHQMAHWLKNDSLSPYNYEVIDVAFRLAGTGSVGLKRFVYLLESKNDEGEEYLLLDMKQSTPSSLEKYLPAPQPAWESEARRIVTIQTRMQNRPPALLSLLEYNGEPYVIQEMQPVKDSINFKLIRKNYRDMCRVIEDMAMLTASAQLRSTGQQGSAITDDLMAFGKADGWQEPLLSYASGYSHKVRSDYHDFLAAFREGAFNDDRRQPDFFREEIAVPGEA